MACESTTESNQPVTFRNRPWFSPWVPYRPAMTVDWGGFRADPNNLPQALPGVYVIVHIDSRRAYVGCSSNVARRLGVAQAQQEGLSAGKGDFRTRFALVPRSAGNLPAP